MVVVKLNLVKTLFKLEAFKMRYLRAISGVKLRDRVRNEAVRTARQMNTKITDTIKPKGSSYLGMWPKDLQTVK